MDNGMNSGTPPELPGRPDLNKLRLRPPAPADVPETGSEKRENDFNKEKKMAYYEENRNSSNGSVRFNTNTPPYREEKRPGRLSWFLSGMLGCGCLILLLPVISLFLFLFLLGTFDGGWENGTAAITREAKNFTSDFSRKFAGGKKGASDKIAVIPVRGLITSREDGRFSRNAVSSTIVKMIREVAGDDSVKAVIIDLDTPGGEVTASDRIYHELTLLRKKKPVIAYMNSICASGGYYIAAACHPIVANKLTLTGSIGVIISTYNYKGLFEKIGLKAEVYTSGRMKDMLNGARERTPEETAIIRKLVMNTYHTFTDIVSRSRGIPAETLRNSIIGDGRIFDGKQALEHNLVDSLGYFEDAVSATVKEAKIKGPWEVVRLEEEFQFERFFKELFAGASAVNLLPGSSSGAVQLEAGKLYFLPPGL